MTSLRWGLIGASHDRRRAYDRRHPRQWRRGDGGDERDAGARGRLRAPARHRARDVEPRGELVGGGDVDAVYISTTNELHRDQFFAAARGGQACAVREAARADAGRCAGDGGASAMTRGVVMGTNHHLRNAATHRAMREAIQQGRIGRPLFARVFHAVFLPPHLQGWRIAKPRGRRRRRARHHRATTPTRCASCSTTSRSRSAR